MIDRNERDRFQATAVALGLRKMVEGLSGYVALIWMVAAITVMLAAMKLEGMVDFSWVTIAIVFGIIPGFTLIRATIGAIFGGVK